MKKLYLLHTLYEPNTAPTNRLLSFLKAFSEFGIEVEMVFVLPDKCFSKHPEELPHVSFNYLWEGQHSKNPYIKQILFTYNVWRFSRKLSPGDTIIVMDMSRAVISLSSKHKFKVFHEKTEHPYAYKVRTVNVEKYIKACTKLDGMFVISRPLKDYFIQRGVNSGRIQIINMTVDISRFEGLTKDKKVEKYIAYCGTASHSKDGVDELIKAFSIFHQSHPEYKLYIIGKVPSKEEEKDNIRLIESLKLTNSINLTGVISYDEMPQMLVNASILALDRPDSLQAKNGFPTKLGEYLLSGNPVVVTNVGDIPYFLEDGVSAMIAKERDANHFAEKLKWLAEHPNEATEIGKNGRRVALQSFNASTETRKMLDFINTQSK
jgi:glycosyltransferase involved in cell wall biosynthesis